jgi:hypothetical protein
MKFIKSIGVRGYHKNELDPPLIEGLFFSLILPTIFFCTLHLFLQLSFIEVGGPELWSHLNPPLETVSSPINRRGLFILFIFISKDHSKGPRINRVVYALIYTINLSRCCQPSQATTPPCSLLPATASPVPSSWSSAPPAKPKRFDGGRPASQDRKNLPSRSCAAGGHSRRDRRHNHGLRQQWPPRPRRHSHSRPATSFSVSKA